MGVGVLAMHFVAVQGWHVAGQVNWNGYGLVLTLLLAWGLSALAVNRANRPVTRWRRHGAAIVLAFMVCTLHYTLIASASVTSDAAAVVPAWLIPAPTLASPWSAPCCW